MDMFIKPGVICLYVADSLTRSPVRCSIDGNFRISYPSAEVYKVYVIGKEDDVLGRSFFVYISKDGRMFYPEEIVGVKVFLEENGWNKPNIGANEYGFLCRESSLNKFFPDINRRLDELLG